MGLLWRYKKFAQSLVSLKGKGLFGDNNKSIKLFLIHKKAKWGENSLVSKVSMGSKSLRALTAERSLDFLV